MTVISDFGGSETLRDETLAAPYCVQQADSWLRSVQGESLETMMSQARGLRENGHGDVISYSRKVFIPLTRLCRDSCAYCTFATIPKEVPAPYLPPDEVLAIADAGRNAGCHEALFTVGDKRSYAIRRRGMP